MGSGCVRITIIPTTIISIVIAKYYCSNSQAKWSQNGAKMNDFPISRFGNGSLAYYIFCIPPDDMANCTASVYILQSSSLTGREVE